MQVDKRIIDGLLNLIKDELFNEKWITIHPHGSAEDENGKRDYRRIKLEDGETPKEAIERVYGKNDKNKKDKEEKKEKSLSDMSVDELKAKKKALWTDLMKKYNNPKDPKKVIPLAERKQYLADVEKIDEILKGKANKDTKDVKKVEKPVKEVKKEESFKDKLENLKKEIQQIDKDFEEYNKVNMTHQHAIDRFWDENTDRDEVNKLINAYIDKHKDELEKLSNQYKELEHLRISKQNEYDDIINKKVEELTKTDLKKLNENELNKLKENINEFLQESMPFKSREMLHKLKYAINDQVNALKYKKERKEITEIANVKKGKPMTHQQADSGNVNPNYRIQQGCTTNCQTCVVVYEARLRGFNVKALGNFQNPTIKQLSHFTNRAWINPETGRPPEYITDINVKNSKTCISWLEKEVKQGERYTLEWSWKGRSHKGHIVTISKDKNNNLSIYDPQTNSTLTGTGALNEYFKEFKYKSSVYGTKIPHPPKLLRVDNLDFNKEVVDKIMNKA